ncbi:MAG: hypothetical protein MI757_09410 [Pirellulales bacterium]|nr:hypothetical protein [Pirellulales bacterium]
MVRCLVTLISVVVLSSSAWAAEWGTLKGRFVLDGKAPAPAKLAIAKDKEACCADGCPTDDSLLVGPDGGLANVVIYVRTKKGDKIAVHPDYVKDADAKLVLDNKNCVFVPHVSTIRTGQTLVLKNSDAVAHNTNIQPIKPGNTPSNVTIPAGGSAEYKFNEAETLPTPAICNIHPWMKSYVLARDDPYATVSAKDGTFEIKNLPAGGELEFQLWHERAGYVRDVDVNGTTAKRGRVKIDIKAGDNDVGEIKVPVSLLEEK